MKFLSKNITKFASFCNQNRGGEKKSVLRNTHGRLPGDYRPLINQSECAYYRSHITNGIKSSSMEGISPFKITLMLTCT